MQMYMIMQTESIIGHVLSASSVCYE